jgi:hypothetical protein
MKQAPVPSSELTAKQRLAVSRQALANTFVEPLWASLARWCIRRSVDRMKVKAQSDRVTTGRTLS